MRNLLVSLVMSLVSVGVQAGGDGLIRQKSVHSVSVTADRLVGILESKGLKVFARINHAAGAEKAGLSLPPTELILFGNPKLGTPLMNCARTVAIDLPQKALIWADEAGQSWLAYNDPQYLKDRHVIEGCDPVLKKVAGALSKLTGKAVSK